MSNISTFHVAQKSMWIKRIAADTSGKWGYLFQAVCGINKEMLDHKLPESYMRKFNHAKFHKQVLECWFKIKSRPPETVQEILNEYICFNKYITIGEIMIQPAFFGKQNEYISIKIQHLLNNSNRIGNHEEIQIRLQCHKNFLWTNSLINAIPREWKAKIDNNNQIFKDIPYLYIKINKMFKSMLNIQSKSVYWKLMNEMTSPPTEISTWIDLYPFMEKIDWKCVFSLVYKLTREPHLQTVQYKIVNRTLNCNYNLSIWKIIATNKCNYCAEVDTLEHHLYYCFVSKMFWKKVTKWLRELTNIRKHFQSVKSYLA